MGGAEAGGIWLDKIDRDAMLAGEDITRQAIRQELFERAATAAVRAQAIIDVAGSDVQNASRFGTFDHQTSNPIPTGRLPIADEDGRSFGFARVHISRDTELVPEEVPGLFRNRKVLVTKVTDRVNRFGVVFYAGQEDGSDLTDFASAQWSITDGYENPDGMTRVEEYLETARAALADKQM